MILKIVSIYISKWKSWIKSSFQTLWIPMEPFQTRPSLTRSDPALIDSITPPLYYITSPFTNLKQRRARLGLRPCQRGETLTRSSKKVKEGEERKGGIENPQRDRLNCRKCLRRWGELEDRREEGEKGENRKSIGRQSRRMKIEGWCGWDLGAGEVAFKRDCRVAWALSGHCWKRGDGGDAGTRNQLPEVTI